ncbi:hypothetical protein B0J14DRAFT_701332 [Halenospora varia]|nr:hypothetical protein B0J14DRAFT_701332 [Halenospora varia]
MAQNTPAIDPDLNVHPLNAEFRDVNNVPSEGLVPDRHIPRETPCNNVDKNHLGAKSKKTSTAKSRVSRHGYLGQPGPSHDSRPKLPVQRSPGLLTRFSGALGLSRLSLGQEPSSDRPNSQEYKESREQSEDLNAALQEKEAQIAQLLTESQERTNVHHTEVARIHDQKRQWEHKAKKIQRECDELRRERDETVRGLKIKLRGIEGEKHAVQDKYNAFVRSQQEAEFRQMESGKWTPDDESKITGELERLRREVKSLAKGIAMKNIVVALNDNRLPPGLSTAKSPSLLLNALLSHAVYTSFFSSPFFFLSGGLRTDLDGNGVEKILDEIYQAAQESNPHDAHIWRSQTMRLLLPRLGNNVTDGEKALHHCTEAKIAGLSEKQASNFITGPARHLINAETKVDYSKKIKGIYQEAASLSYRLWTRRTAMKFSGLHELEHPAFDIDDPRLAPHTLVQYDEHEDQLRGRPITVVVHPLLEVYGTDEAENYGDARVWVPAEVWLDSKQSEASELR